MRHARLLLLVLTMLLALPPGLFATNVVVGPRLTGAPGFAAPQDIEPVQNTPGFDARKRDKRKAERRQERKAERKERRERQRRGQSAEQARIEARVEAAPPRIPALAEEDDPCGPGLIQLPKSGRCTHGPDDLPPTGSGAPGQTALTASETRRAVAEVACDGDGASGFRIQVLYLRASTGADDYADTLDDIRGWSAGADAILRDSSTVAGQEIGFTFVMTDGCEIDVQNVVISPSAIRNFDATIEALEQQGYDRVDRIYLMFADTGSAGICGIGTMWMDDRNTATNANNRGPSYARADRTCWDEHTAAHELMHNLGAVQDSAPHTTGYGHCIDEYDVMCYRDDRDAPPMQFVCTPENTFEYRYDCGFDDYFNPLPEPENYLATHWNAAENWFLTQEAPPDADLVRPVVTWVAPVGNGQTHVAGSGVVSLQANATDASGVEYVDFWLYDELRDDWVYLGNDHDAPYTSSVVVSDLRLGLNFVAADAFDTQGNWDEEGIWIQRTEIAPATAISLATSTARVKAKKRVTLTAAVANAPVGGAGVEFRFCRGSNCTWAAGQSLGVFPGVTPTTSWQASGKGRVTFLAQITGEDGAVTSNPATVSVKKDKKRKR